MGSKEQLNLQVLQRFDGNIAQVLQTVGHVTLYNFNQEQQIWEKKEVEGSLFVVKRISEPQFQFIVMNRLSTKNVVEDITASFQIQIAEPYLLYRNNTGQIQGIWFYNPQEREKVCTMLDSIINYQKQSTDTRSITNIISSAISSKSTSSALSKDQFKGLLIKLSQDDQFVELVYKEYIKSVQ